MTLSSAVLPCSVPWRARTTLCWAGKSRKRPTEMFLPLVAFPNATLDVDPLHPLKPARVKKKEKKPPDPSLTSPLAPA